MLALREVSGDHPDAARVREDIVRGLSRPGQPGLRRSLLKATQVIQVRTPAGLDLGARLGYAVELDRLDRVVTRTVRGLFFHRFGRRLPSTYLAHVFAEDGLASLGSEHKTAIQRDLLRPVLGNAPESIGDEVLTYWVALAEDDPNVTAWVLRFYRAVHFIGVTMPREQAT